MTWRIYMHDGLAVVVDAIKPFAAVLYCCTYCQADPHLIETWRIVPCLGLCLLHFGLGSSLDNTQEVICGLSSFRFAPANGAHFQSWSDCELQSLEALARSTISTIWAGKRSIFYLCMNNRIRNNENGWSQWSCLATRHVSWGKGVPVFDGKMQEVFTWITSLPESLGYFAHSGRLPCWRWLHAPSAMKDRQHWCQQRIHSPKWTRQWRWQGWTTSQMQCARHLSWSTCWIPSSQTSTTAQSHQSWGYHFENIHGDVNLHSTLPLQLLNCNFQMKLKRGTERDVLIWNTAKRRLVAWNEHNTCPSSSSRVLSANYSYDGATSHNQAYLEHHDQGNSKIVKTGESVVWVANGSQANLCLICWTMKALKDKWLLILLVSAAEAAVVKPLAQVWVRI